MKTLLIILLLLPCFCLAQIRPDKPEPAKAPDKVTKDSGLKSLWTNATASEAYRINGGDTTWLYRRTNSAQKQDILKLIDSLKKELLKCQEKSRKDEIIIEGIFNTIQKKVTIQTKKSY